MIHPGTVYFEDRAIGYVTAAPWAAPSESWPWLGYSIGIERIFRRLDVGPFDALKSLKFELARFVRALKNCRAPLLQMAL